ncbi:MAG: hypothetical protein RLZZ165_1338 [Bacteroidota bacterium]
MSCAVLSIQACQPSKRLVLFADPWLEEYADSLTMLFGRSHPDVDVELKVVSSEVAVQHIRYGQPVDVFLCYGLEMFQGADFRSRIAHVHPIADSRILEVHGPPHPNQARFATGGCSMVEASDRPSRIYAERSFGDIASGPGCVIIANFQSQAADYLRLGWVPGGYVPSHFAASLPDGFERVRQSGRIRDAFAAALMADRPDPEEAAAFWELLRSEKSCLLVEKLKFLP